MQSAKNTYRRHWTMIQINSRSIHYATISITGQWKPKTLSRSMIKPELWHIDWIRINANYFSAILRSWKVVKDLKSSEVTTLRSSNLDWSELGKIAWVIASLLHYNKAMTFFQTPVSLNCLTWLYLQNTLAWLNDFSTVIASSIVKSMANFNYQENG